MITESAIAKGVLINKQISYRLNCSVLGNRNTTQFGPKEHKNEGDSDVKSLQVDANSVRWWVRIGEETRTDLFERMPDFFGDLVQLFPVGLLKILGWEFKPEPVAIVTRDHVQVNVEDFLHCC